MILGPRLSRSTSLLSTLVVLGAYLMNSPAAAAAACRFSRVGLTGPPDSPNTLLFIPSNLSNYLPQTSSVSIFIIRKVPYHIVVGGKQITCFYRVFNLRVSNKYNLYADDTGIHPISLINKVHKNAATHPDPRRFKMEGRTRNSIT